LYPVHTGTRDVSYVRNDNRDEHNVSNTPRNDDDDDDDGGDNNNHKKRTNGTQTSHRDKNNDNDLSSDFTDDTSEFTTSEQPLIEISRKNSQSSSQTTSDNPTTVDGGGVAAVNGSTDPNDTTTGQKAETTPTNAEKDTTSAANDPQKSPNSHFKPHDANSPNNPSDPHDGGFSPDSFGGDSGSKGDKKGGKSGERQWPRFNQDIYSRVYAPNASISPKLSSCLVLTLPNTMRPLFPGLYCPVTIRDPALVTQILKQTYKGFPYIGVFLRKNKQKDDIFTNKVTIPSTDAKNPPLLINNKDLGNVGGKNKAQNAQNATNNDNIIADGTVDPDNLHTIGTFAHIFNITHLNNGAIHMLLVGLRRIELDSVKYDLVPNFDSKKITSLISTIFPGTNPPPPPPPSQQQQQQQHQSYESDGKKRRHNLTSSSGGSSHDGALVIKGSTHRSRSGYDDDDGKGDHSVEDSTDLLESVMNTGIQQHPEYMDPSVPLPNTLKRVLIGNITHHDEDSVISATTHPDGTLKTPLELSRQEEIYKVYTTEILSAARELLQQSSPGVLEQLQYLHSSFDFSNPVFFTDFVSNLTNAPSEQMQQLLSTLDVTKRMHLTLLLIKREVEMSRFHTDIQNSVEENLRATQREFYLKQQLQQIKKELGLEKGDEKLTLSNKFKSRVKNRWDDIPQYAKTVIEDELSKLDTLETSSSEYNVTRNYLEWLTSLPWSHSTEEIYSLKRTETTLNEEHYGMQDVKDRILEFVAVGQLLQKQQKLADEKLKQNQFDKNDKNGKPIIIDIKSANSDSASTTLNITNDEAPTEFIIPIKKNKFKDDVHNDPHPDPLSKDPGSTDPKDKHQAATGKIMLFVGPPGVGKTSIGKSIAKSLNREFFRFSVGGLSDVSEIKGHRRTYVGALPGKIVQALKKTQCSNPVILIDEIDKIGRGSNHGDPSSALLEVLDPEQNATFTDHYMDIPIDLSKVLFICTANSLETISGPLRDRMDIVELSGYIQQEKEHIAKHYLEPQLLKRCGLESHEAEITMDTVSHLVKWYCREAGVRRLQKYMEMIYRKVAFRVVRNDPLPIRVTVDNLSEYVGQELYQSDRMYDRTPVGVVAGLAWSQAGGSTMYIESAVSHNVFNRKKWGLDKLEDRVKVEQIDTLRTDDNRDNGRDDDFSNDAVEIFEIHGGNTIRTQIDVVTHDSEVIIKSNNNSDVDIRNDGLAPSRRKHIHIVSDTDSVKNVQNDTHVTAANNASALSNHKPTQNTTPSDKSKKKKKKKKTPNDSNRHSDDNDDAETSDDEVLPDIKEGNGSLKLTGSLGEVMKESASIAYSLSKHYLHKLVAEYETVKIHNNKGKIVENDEQIEQIGFEFDLGVQDAPIDPINCKIPILRPPISNSTSVASKIQDNKLTHKQSQIKPKNNEKIDQNDTQTENKQHERDQLQTEISRRISELLTLESQLQKMTQSTAHGEDDLFAGEVQPILHDNPQRTLQPGSSYTTPSSLKLPKRYLPTPDPNFFNTAQIHIHAPSGSTPKDGPSAGIALLSILLSQALNRPLVNNIAMTGEISLTGKVLPIGGLREKIIGARQSNIYHLIVPKANMHDIAELPSFITSGLTIYFAESCDEVVRLVFGAPHALNGANSKPTLVKKYDIFDGDADLEILKMQNGEKKNNNLKNQNDEPNEISPPTLTDAVVIDASLSSPQSAPPSAAFSMYSQRNSPFSV